MKVKKDIIDVLWTITKTPDKNTRILKKCNHHYEESKDSYDWKLRFNVEKLA